MKYLIIYDEGHGYQSNYEFETRDKADAYLHDRLILCQNDPDDYKLFEFTQKFEVGIAAKAYAYLLDQKRKNALDKLTETDKIVLGLA